MPVKSEQAMNYYVDMDVRPDLDFSVDNLMAALYGRLHRALAAMNVVSVGVSFPGYDVSSSHVGGRMRLHGSCEALTALFEGDWLKGVRDYLDVTKPCPVPEGVQHRKVFRVQTKSSPARLRRRLMRRHGTDEQKALTQIPDAVARYANLPYVQFRSSSTGQPFRLFIDHGPLQAHPEPGRFSSYGLSHGATVPWF